MVVLRVVACLLLAKASALAIPESAVNHGMQLSTLVAIHVSPEELHRNSTDAPCRNDILFLVESLLQGEIWAIQMVDAFGKLPAGLLKGNIQWPGNYRECRNIMVEPSHGLTYSTNGFKGRYCSLQWTLQINETGLQKVPLSFGLCLPDTCSAADLSVAISELKSILDKLPILNHSLANSTDAEFTCQPDHVQWTCLGIFCLFLFGMVAALMVVGTTLDILFQNNKANMQHAVDKVQGTTSFNASSLRGQLQTILVCFSIYTNGKKLFNTSRAKGELPCLHGLRFLSMCWVILGHVYSLGMLNLSNPLEAVNEVKMFTFQSVLQGTYAVDTFFVLSGFLLTYLFMREISKTNGKINWVQFYAHRWWRLSPILCVAMCTYVGILPHLGEGPFWLDFGPTLATCSKYWWTTLLYINNMWSGQDQCLSWTWYLANDMQFYTISPLFLLPLWKWPLMGLMVVAALTLTSWVALFSIAYIHHYVPVFSIQDPQATNMQEMFAMQEEAMDSIYVKPWCRIGPYLVGVFLGYLLYRLEGKQYVIPQISRITGWILSTALTLSVIYGLYDVKLGRLGSAFYLAFGRSVYGLGVAWVIFACTKGHGGLIDSLLSLKIFVPLSRLTYCAYLFHPLIGFSLFYGKQSTTYFSHLTMVCYFLAALVMSYGLAAVFSLAFESPMRCLEKVRCNRKACHSASTMQTEDQTQLSRT